jgi:hypothetical protein
MEAVGAYVYLEGLTGQKSSAGVDGCSVVRTATIPTTG